MLSIKSKAGFTLIELGVVLVIIGVVAALAIPYIGDAYTSMSIRAAATNIVKQAEVINYGAKKIFAETTAEITLLSSLTTGSNPSLEALPAPPYSAAGTGAVNPFAFALDSINYTGWGGASADTVITLTGLKPAVCQKINDDFTNLGIGAAIPAAVDTSKNLLCFGAGTVGNPYTFVRTIAVPDMTTNGLADASCTFKPV